MDRITTPQAVVETATDLRFNVFNGVSQLLPLPHPFISRGGTESISELIDHTLYKSICYLQETKQLVP
jgi:hypothetical protein